MLHGLLSPGPDMHGLLSACPDMHGLSQLVLICMVSSQLVLICMVDIQLCDCSVLQEEYAMNIRKVILMMTRRAQPPYPGERHTL